MSEFNTNDDNVQYNEQDKVTNNDALDEGIYPIEIHSVDQNKSYLQVKKERMGHNLSEFN